MSVILLSKIYTGIKAVPVFVMDTNYYESRVDFCTAGNRIHISCCYFGENITK